MKDVKGDRSSTGPTRVAAIGVNHWHALYDAAYLRHLAQMEDVEVVGVHDDDLDIASHRARGGVASFTDYRLMVSEVEPDFVLALGRHDVMAEIAHYLMEIHVPFIMEKPMSFNARQLTGVVERAQAIGGFAAVPLSNRYGPFFKNAKKIRDEGTYGPMTHFYARMNWPTSQRYVRWESPWMLEPTAANGGCLRNLGAHGLDMFVCLTGGGENVEVTGAQLSWSAEGQPVEDYASVLIRSPSGVLGTIETGTSFPRDGTDGEFKVGFRDALLTFKDDVLRLNTSSGEEILPSKPKSTEGMTMRQRNGR